MSYQTDGGSILKRPDDALNYQMNFAAQPEVGSGAETLASAAASVVGSSGPAADDTPLACGACAVAGAAATFLVTGGTDRLDYEVQCTGTYASGRKRVLTFEVQVRG
jgi:hypothetical protein